MISYQNALSLLFKIAEEHLKSKDCIITLPMKHALGHTLAEAIISSENFPAFTASMVDGFAVKSADTEQASTNNPLTFPVTAINYAGENTSSQKFAAFTCIEITTGALLPEAYDAIIMREHATETIDKTTGKTTSIAITNPAIIGENIRLQGSDISKNQLIFEENTKIELNHLPVLAALGVQECKVYEQLLIGIVSTGNEVADISFAQTKLKLGMIRNATSMFLGKALEILGAKVIDFGHVNDDPQGYISLINQAQEQKCSVFISTGAVSVGPRDFISQALQSLDAEIIFHKVQMRPGKPTLAARIKKPDINDKSIFNYMTIFGLPGNPMATIAAFRFLVTPFILALFKQKKEEPVKVRLGNSFYKAKDFRCFLLANCKQTNEGSIAYTKSEQDSYRILPFSRSTAWVSSSEILSGSSAGDQVDVYPLLYDGFKKEILF